MEVASPSLCRGRVSNSCSRLLILRANRQCRRGKGSFQKARPFQLSTLGSRAALHVCAAADTGPGISDELKVSLDQYVTQNKIVLFMKGTREFPQCGFSNTTVQILNTLQVPYETVNILESDVLREGMKLYSQWPTFPQVYIDGEFFGGCDIMIESFQSGELKEAIEKAMNS